MILLIEACLLSNWMREFRTTSVSIVRAPVRARYFLSCHDHVARVQSYQPSRVGLWMGPERGGGVGGVVRGVGVHGVG